MKYPGWIAGVGALAVVVFMLEFPKHIHGATWAVVVASICVFAVGLALLHAAASWYDRRKAKAERDLAREVGNVDA